MEPKEMKQMTKQEALEMLKELEEYIESLNKKVGYEDDTLFLLSTEEYVKYKDLIPECKIQWWLRSPGYRDGNAAYVALSGMVMPIGCGMCNIIAIRPALKVNTYGYKIGEKILYNKFPFTVIDENLCIATVPVAFDAFSNDGNDYTNSDVREFLLEGFYEN